MNENLRSIVHRIAGVVLIAAAFYNLVYLALYRDGHRLPAASSQVRSL